MFTLYFVYIQCISHHSVTFELTQIYTTLHLILLLFSLYLVCTYYLKVKDLSTVEFLLSGLLVFEFTLY